MTSPEWLSKDLQNASPYEQWKLWQKLSVSTFPELGELTKACSIQGVLVKKVYVP